MATTKDVSQWIRGNPNQLITVAVSVLVIGLSGWIGLKARAAGDSLAKSRRAWEDVANQLATVRQQFRVPTSSESAAIISESSRMGALGIPNAEKLNVLDAVGRLAEACALGDVRVSAIAVSDSSYAADRQVAGINIKHADYAVAVEFAGSFANAVKFVSSLPPSVSLARMSAAKRNGASQYYLVLSVYELDAQPGS
jgi:hypothetical protein